MSPALSSSHFRTPGFKFLSLVHLCFLCTFWVTEVRGQLQSSTWWGTVFPDTFINEAILSSVDVSGSLVKTQLAANVWAPWWDFCCFVGLHVCCYGNTTLYWFYILKSSTVRTPALSFILPRISLLFMIFYTSLRILGWLSRCLKNCFNILVCFSLTLPACHFG